MDQIFSTVVTSALVATIAGAAINFWLQSRKERHVTRFDALTAAIILEGYAISCADKLSNHALAKASDGHAGTFMESLPELPKLSIVAGFLKPARARVADRLMFFPYEVRQADQVATFLWDVTTDVDAVREASVAQAAKMGLYALDLSADIREAFKLPKRKIVFGAFDVREVLEKSRQSDQGSA